MSNRSLWNVRRRHEWLATPLKGKHLKKRKRVRIGLEQALERKAEKAAASAPSADASAQ
ncbi:MAG TPA: hypothetical protein VMS65_15655 [Polyangiaceae bacterium]|nr:hypothetical protein [Polyangiaceae bacterium]